MAFVCAGAQAIAHAVKSKGTLVSLDLSQCGLTDMGGAQLALSLTDNRFLDSFPPLPRPACRPPPNLWAVVWQTRLLVAFALLDQCFWQSHTGKNREVD